jgi:hypothetical protein
MVKTELPSGRRNSSFTFRGLCPAPEALPGDHQTFECIQATGASARRFGFGLFDPKHLLTQLKHVTRMDGVFFYALAVEIGTMGASQIFDVRRIEKGDDFGVVGIYLHVLDAQIVFIGSANQNDALL